MDKKYLIVIVVLILTYIGIDRYFAFTIEKQKNIYTTKQTLSMEYTKLKNRYSKQALEKKAKKIFEFLDTFGISYKKHISQTGTTSIDMQLDGRNINKVVNYILNIDIPYKSIDMTKKDNYNLSFKVSF